MAAFAIHDGKVLVVPKGTATVADVPEQLADQADVVLTADGRLLKSRWTTREW